MSTQWTNFYLALSVAAAALAGLIFIAIGGNIRAWNDHSLRKIIGLRTFAEFVLPFLFSMTTLMPGFDWRVSALLIAVAGTGIAWVYSSKAKKHPELLNSAFDKAQYDSVFTSASPYLSLGLVAFCHEFIPSGSSDLGLMLVAGLLLLLMLAGLLRAWNIYMYPPEAAVS